MIPIQKLPEWTGANRFKKPVKHLSISDQVVVLCTTLGTAPLTRGLVPQKPKKKVGQKLAAARQRTTIQLIEACIRAGYHMVDITHLAQKHIAAAVQNWEANGDTEATMAARMSHLRWLCEAVGKPGMLHELQYYVTDPFADAAASPATPTDESTPDLPNLEELIATIGAADQWVGMVLSLIRHFGLSFPECMALRPHLAWVGKTLRIEEGTRSGRPRVIHVTTSAQREILEAVKSYSMRNPNRRICPSGKSIEAARDHFNYVCRKHGIKSANQLTTRTLRKMSMNHRSLPDATAQREAYVGRFLP